VEEAEGETEKTGGKTYIFNIPCCGPWFIITSFDSQIKSVCGVLFKNDN
jgi:hypothetical protein